MSRPPVGSVADVVAAVLPLSDSSFVTGVVPAVDGSAPVAPGNPRARGLPGLVKIQVPRDGISADHKRALIQGATELLRRERDNRG